MALLEATVVVVAVDFVVVVVIAVVVDIVVVGVNVLLWPCLLLLITFYLVVVNKC